tara:strand:+ start:71 stop:688 length:618 start_codon:yes stop_codon:yes gene_type:complete
MNIGILSYGCGNTSSFVNSFNQLGINNTIVYESSQFKELSHIVLPGVGSFDDVIDKLIDSNLIKILEKFVHNYKIPFLGVCSGMQVLFEFSEEGNNEGLGWIKGNVKKFQSKLNNKNLLKVPHIGWNKVQISHGEFFKFCNDEEYYFLHSYYCSPSIKVDSKLDSFYGLHFNSAIQIDNILATQFHPEKSHKAGLKLLQKFSEIN